MTNSQQYYRSLHESTISLFDYGWVILLYEDTSRGKAMESWFFFPESSQICAISSLLDYNKAVKGNRDTPR